MLWQTLDDDKSGHKRFGMTRNVALNDDWWAEFESQNEMGFGVFVMVNEGDGTGKRDADHVTALRALFVDDDKGVLDPEAMTWCETRRRRYTRRELGDAIDHAVTLRT